MNCKSRTAYRLCGSILFFVLTLLLAVKPTAAAPRSSYYDYGPYYDNKEKVLGVTFSSLEELPAPTIPQDALPPKARGILPGNPLYNFEILTENIQLGLTFNPVQKEVKRLAFAEERLGEVKTLVDGNRWDLANDAASNYQNIMDTVSKNAQSLSSKNVSGAQDLLTKIEEAASAHAVVAQSLVFSSPPSTTVSWNKVIDGAEGAMDAMSDAKNQPPIPEELSVSIQELKEQGLITSEESDKLYTLSSRADVRQELDKLVTSGEFPIAEVIKLNESVANNYPESYKDTEGVLKFAELRTYETFPPPSEEILNGIARWQNDSADVPPPGEIRPYLYWSRAQDLAKDIDFSRFEVEQQSEVARFYPESVVQNPTFSGAPITSPAPVPSPTPSPTQTGKVTPAPSLSPTISPTPEPLPIGPYLTPYNGPLPGTFGYFFKNIGEQVSLTTTFDSTRRLELKMNYADERLREARALSSETGKEKLYEDALNSYQKIMDSVSEDVGNFGGSEEDKRDLAKALELEAARHNVIFEKGLLPPPSGDTKTYIAAIEASEDAMDKTSDVLGRPPLPVQLVNRLQDMKAQGIILEEEVSALTNANSREEVREKIRELTQSGIFPPADAKKLDEGQALVTPADYNQLTEVRKIEELQGLRLVQAEFAQTPTLRATNDSYAERVKQLLENIDPSLIKPEDLAGRDDLLKIYREVAAKDIARPVNSGQFPTQVSQTPPSPADAVLTICPIGAVFKESEGCVWEENGHKINDYEEYRCQRPNEYYSFAANKCVIYDPQAGRADDEKPVCPAGYSWSWENQTCTTSSGVRPLPTPVPTGEPEEPTDEEKAKLCPTGATYKPPQGCVWDDNGKAIYDNSQYRCGEAGGYYSFEKRRCVPAPEGNKGYPEDAAPTCPEGRVWLWNENKCQEPQTFESQQYRIVDSNDYKPSFVTPDSPFYFLKQTVETIQSATAFSTQRRQEVRIAQAKERFAESLYFLGKKDEERFQEVLGDYIDTMQDVYNDANAIQKLSDSAQKALGEKLAQASVEQNVLLQQAATLASDDVATSLTAAISTTTQGIDRAADLKGEPAIPEDLKDKIEELPKDMLPDDKKKEILGIDNRVEARLALGGLVAAGGLTTLDTAPLDQELQSVDPAAQTKLSELNKLNEISDLTTKSSDLKEKIEKNEDIVQKLDDFQKTFEVGQDLPSDIRPYVRLTRIEEVSQTVRPDIIRLVDFQNRKDVQLAVATLQQEFKPTVQDARRVEEFRRANPGRALPPELARIEALSFSLGFRQSSGECFLPSPPFAPNTPCPPTGAAIPIYSSTYRIFGDAIISDEFRPGWPGGPSLSVDKDGKPLVYGKGPETTKPGVCPDGYHWMYDSGGWCMSNSGSYGGGGPGSYTPYGGSGSGATPYSPYYSTPGYPPTSYGYQGPGTYTGSPYPYAPPSYWGVAPTSYTTNPPPGTVPGTGPSPTAPGQCPSGYHWMPPSSYQAGWCMADGGTYVGGGGYGSSTYSSSGYNCGSRPWDPVLQRCSDGACPGGYSWDGSKCVPFTSSGGYYSPYSPYSGSSNYYSGSNSCSYPAGGCGYNSYWDYGSCSCRSASSYSGGSGPSTSNYCQGISCGGGSYLDYSTCSCRYSSSGGYTSGSSSCTPPPGGCGSGWFDTSACSCKAASSEGCYNVSASSCGSGFYWDSSACTCRSSSTSSSGTTSSGGTSSGSCPSGYHWMSDSGGWCMSDGATGGGSTSTSTSTSTESTTPPPTTTESSTPSEPAPTSSP